MDILITGTSSGLGKHLQEIFKGRALTRENSSEVIRSLRADGVEVILHAAFSSAPDPTSKDLSRFAEDNILLTQKLVSIPHRKFVYISSTEVYPKNRHRHTEDEAIPLDLTSGAYGWAKLVAETVVLRNSPNALILRCAGLLGRYSRKGALKRILEDAHPAVTLTAGSACNFIPHTAVSEFIELALQNDLCGIYNLASRENITAAEIAEAAGKKVTFGKHAYDVGHIANDKAARVLASLGRTSREIVKEYRP